MRTVEHRPGRLADLHGDEQAGSVVLLWHGSGPDERDVLRPLASAVAAEGLLVVVPDWDSTAADGGRADLLASLDLARAQGAPLGAVVGWSLGADAALSLGVHAGRRGLSLPRVVGLSGGYDDDPLDGPELVVPTRSDEPTSFVLVHGRRDEVVPFERMRAGASLLGDRGWPVRTVPLDTDHAGVVGTSYDADARRCVPRLPFDEAAQVVVRLVAGSDDR